ncbi:MAG: acetolactate synthase-1/3 small subunit [Myxococcota bacterium]|jgi:acetolactate synthase-1/3 small subunit
MTGHSISTTALTGITAQQASQRTFVALMEDRPGVLNRVVSLLRRRNFNIVSLSVGRTHEPGVSRMTVVIEASPDTGRRIEAHLYKLVNILRVDDITESPRIDRVLALIKVSVGADQRGEVVQISELFRARVVDVAADSLVVEITGTRDKVDGLTGMLAPFGIDEMVQTGCVAMTRGPASAPNAHNTL